MRNLQGACPHKVGGGANEWTGCFNMVHQDLEILTRIKDKQLQMLRGRFLVKPSLIIWYVTTKVKNRNLRSDVIRLTLQMSRFWSVLQRHSAITVLTRFLQPTKEAWQGNISTPVCHSVHKREVSASMSGVFVSWSRRGVCVHTPRHTPFGHPQTHTPWTHTPPDAPSGHTPSWKHPSWSISGWYTSYWNAFLFSGISYQNFLSIKLF